MYKSSEVKVLIFVFLMMFPLMLKGQGGSCIDPTLIREYTNCNWEGYYPVCGCDGITYMNMCSAVQHGGLLWISNEGPCEPLGAYIHFNPVDFYLDITVATRQLYNVVVEILDLSGNKHFQQRFTIDGMLNLHIPSSHLSNGYYILHVFTNNYSHSDYFIKYSF